MAEDSDRKLILVIGPSQNGKSTFINRMIRLSRHTSTQGHAKEGDGNFKQTTNCSFYDVDIPLTDYLLVDFKTGEEYSVPSIEDEEKVLGGSWWKKQKLDRYIVEPRHVKSAPLVKLRLIDTPGLDDSEGKDFENMGDVLATLNDLSKSQEQWQTRITAVVLVYNASNAFSRSFKTLIKDYHQCMPNLFGNLAVINTHFSITILSQKRQHLVREKLLNANNNARSRVIHERQKEFAKILGDQTVPTHFFIDSKPKDTLAFDELVSCNTISQIVTFWSGCVPMKIREMRLVKNSTMIAIDGVLQSFLEKAITRWQAQQNRLKDQAGTEAKLRATLQGQREQTRDRLSRIEDDLSRYDNDSQVFLNAYHTSVNRHALAMAGRWLVRSRIQDELVITESHSEFTVTTQDVAGGRWTSESYNPGEKTWRGKFELEPGKTTSQIARSYTTNRVQHSDTIARLRREQRESERDMASVQDDWEPFGDSSVGRDSELEAVTSCISAARNLIAVLEQPHPPLDKSFGAASRSRYGKPLDDISEEDLYELVKDVSPDILGQLRSVMALAV